MLQKWKTRKIAIKDLTLWDENSRIPDYLFNEKQNELIQILSKKYDLESLAHEIIKDFDLPQLEKIVVWRKRNTNIVLEGNRRLATYQCLINPSIIQDDSLKKKFEVLKNTIQINNSFALEAIVTSSKKDGMRYIDRKHYHGNNEKKWDLYERDHYIKRTRDISQDNVSPKERESIFRTNIGEKVKLLELPEEMKHQILGKGFITTFYRVVDSAHGRKKLKYEKIDHDLEIEDYEYFSSLLKVIVYNILNKKTLDGKKDINSRTLNEDKDIEEYLNSISINDKKKVDELIEAGKATKQTSKQNSDKTQKAKARPIRFFESLSCDIQDDQLIKITDEISNISHKKYSLAATFLLRALVERTLNWCIERYSLRDELFKEFLKENPAKKRHEPGLAFVLGFCIKKADSILSLANPASMLGQWKGHKQLLDITIHGNWARPNDKTLEQLATIIRPTIEGIFSGKILKQQQNTK